MGDGTDRLGGGTGRQRHVERTDMKNGEKGSEVGGRWLLKAPGAWGGEGKRGGGRLSASWGRRRSGEGGPAWHRRDSSRLLR
jgi:hypothetical protein